MDRERHNENQHEHRSQGVRRFQERQNAVKRTSKVRPTPALRLRQEVRAEKTELGRGDGGGPHQTDENSASRCALNHVKKKKRKRNAPVFPGP